MPCKKSDDYKKTEMYKIICNNPEVIFTYVGHTTNFNVRKACHKSACYNPQNVQYNSYKYQFIRANGGWENFKMVFIEKYPCQSKREAEAREQQLIDELRADANACKAHSGFENKKDYLKDYWKEYYCEHKEHLKEGTREYYLENSEELRKKAGAKVTCECGRKVRWSYMTRHRLRPIHTRNM